MMPTRRRFVVKCSSLSLTSILLFAAWSCRTRDSDHATRRVRVAVPSTPITYLPIYLARELGYYQEQSLDVAIEEVPGGSKALQALLGGSVDVTASFFENAIELASEGRQVQSFMLLQERPGFVLVASPASRRKIARIEDLKGAVVGVTTPGSASHHLMNFLLLRHDIAPSEVNITGIGLGPTSVAAMDADMLMQGS